MNSLTRTLAIATLLLISNVDLFSQNVQRRAGGGGGGDPTSIEGTITGKIIDSLNRGPMEFASVALFRMRDSSLVTGVLTDQQGAFKLDKITGGRYYIEVKFMGYDTRSVRGIAIMPQKPNVDIGVIAANPASQNIETVVVMGEKKMLQYNLDKKVINVDRDLAVQGGTAIDVLQNVPSVDVDTEGNVSLRGDGNVNILIDGRPSNLNSLDELPAQMIESVEVITNPSARYDPDGLTGIINIVLKKKQDSGYNGMVSIMMTTKYRYNGSASFNWRRDKVNLFVNYEFRKMNMNTYGISNRQSFTGNDTTFLEQNTDGKRNMMFHNLRAGVDFFINDKTTLSLSGRINPGAFNSDNTTASSISRTSSAFTQNNSRVSSSRSNRMGQEYALLFKRTFNTPGMELTADAFYSQGGGLALTDIVETYPVFGQTLRERTADDGKNSTITIQTDFVSPLGNGGRLEVGLKGIVDNNYSDYRYDEFNNTLNAWQLDTTRSNHFIDGEQIYSAYAIYSNTLFNEKFSYQAGLRVEEQITHTEQRTTEEVADTSRFNFFPSLHLRWEPNQQHGVQLSYSRRVNRPRSSMLNPFINMSDVYNWSKGNPYLEPEFAASLDLSYNLTWKKTRASASVFYRDVQNGFARRTQLLDSLITLSTYYNLTHNESYGMEFILSQPITQWWNINANYSYYYTKLHGDVVPGADAGTAWTAKLTSNFNIAKIASIQVSGNYRSPQIMAGGMGRHGVGGAQGRSDQMYWFDLGARVNVLKSRGTITLRVSDIFNTQKRSADTWDANFFSHSENWRDSRMVWVGFSYKINNYKVRKDKTSGADDVMDEMD